MITIVPDIVAQNEVAQLNAVLATVEFADGGATAGWNAREVKKNQQLTIGMPGYEGLAKTIQTAIERSALFQMAVRPRFIQPIIFNRYAVGMTYGAHIDDPVMSAPSAFPGRIRVDVAFTLFLTDPATYGGGELIVDHGGIEQRIKLGAGSLIAYPATSLHRVTPVTEGVRTSAVGWVQSELRDPAQRAIVFDLDVVRRNIFGAEGKSRNFDMLSKAHANLIRLWADL